MGGIFKAALNKKKKCLVSIASKESGSNSDI